MVGFIKLPRGWMDEPAVSSSNPFTKREAFAWMVEKAAWGTRKIDLQGETVILSRGSLAYSGRQMAQAWQWTEVRVRRFVGRLEEDRLITTEIDAGRRIISICNYDPNQEAVNENDAAATRYRRIGDAQEKNERKGKKIQKASPSERAGRARAADAAGADQDPVIGVYARTPRGRMWRDGPAIVMQLTGLSKAKARTLLGRMLAETRDDCIRVIEILGRAQERHPLMNAEAFLMAAARGCGARERPEPRYGAAWMAEYREALAQTIDYDLDLQAEEVDELPVLVNDGPTR